jgi:hypothetical protein
MPNWLLAPKSGQPANDCPDHQKEGRPNAELALVSAAKAVMRCGVDLGPNFTERGNFFGNSFHAPTIPPQMLKRSPRFGGNGPFLGRLALGGSSVTRLKESLCVIVASPARHASSSVQPTDATIGLV